MSSRQAIDIDEFPTLPLLYKLGKLDASIGSKAEVPPSASINEKVILARSDMTRIKCDAIVNAANKSLLGGGGIDGAIHSAAGNGLYRECLDLNGCETGDAKITKGYELPAKHVIHTVGPVYWSFKDQGEDPSDALASCYIRSLDVARQNGCKTIAFPCISTGIYGYPNKAAAIVAVKAVREYLEAQENEDVEPTAVDAPSEAGATETKPEGEAKALTGEAEESKEGSDEKSQDAEVEITKQTILSKIEKVCFCTFLEKDLSVYEDIIPAFFPPSPGVEGGLDKLENTEDKAEVAEPTAPLETKPESQKPDVDEMDTSASQPKV